MIGGEHTVAAAAAVLNSDDTPCRVLTIRLESDAAGDCYFGLSTVTTEAHRHGFLEAGESWTFGPYSAGTGIRPSEVYIIGTAGDVLFWNGLPA